MGGCVSQHALLGQLGADVDHLKQGHEEGMGNAALDSKDGCLSDRVIGGVPLVPRGGGVGGPGADPGADCMPMPGLGQLAELTRDPSTLHTALVLPPAGSLERGSWSGLWLQGTDLVGIQEQLWWMVMFEAVHPEKNPDFSWARTAAVGKDWGADCEGLGEGTWISSGKA